ncbi:hypothetical protein N4599_02510 [Limosilactobacillus oris]|uniref:hypothetical protein n=1 Tax=Limosilactobacillus oris TaxID=1632 RepID=UPI0021B46131|nr:hypothetical protein [Limosilactobacillus oris]UXC67836.1 hypothetical protein N4599_02510 [Limosilactobacillus oris]
MKGIFRADPTTHISASSDIVPDEYQLKANETFEDPSGLLVPAKLQADLTWRAATEEEHKAYVEAQQEDFLAQNPSKPSESVKAMNSLGMQVAELTKQNQQLKQSVNALGLQLAQVTMNKKNENGGN